MSAASSSRVFLIPSLAGVGASVRIGVSCPRFLTKPPIDLGAGYGGLVRVYRDGRLLAEKRLEFPHAASHLQSGEADWGVAGGLLPTDLATFQYLADEPHPLVEEAMTGDFEGVLSYQARDGSVSSVLIGFVPNRPAGFRYSPILHSGHAFVRDERRSTSLCLVSHTGERDGGQPPNQMRLDAIRRDGAKVGTARIDIPRNSTYVIDYADLLRKTGTPDGSDATIVMRGGCSQFAIFTLFTDRARGCIGLEHSLPPHYYTTAMTSAEGRAQYYREAFADL
jgi:hypothetical protein